MKKITILFLVIFLTGLFLPLVILAGSYQAESTTVHYQGLVPCGLGKPLCDKPFENGECNGNLVKQKKRDKQGNVIGELDGVSCQFCHFFVMIDGIFKFILVYLIPPIAVLMMVIGGMMFYFAGGSPNMMSQGKSLIKSVVIGIVLAYGAYMIIGFALTALGAANANPIKDIFQDGVFTINCQIEL